MMNATIRIGPWHVGHARGSTSKIRCSKAAHRRAASVGASLGAGRVSARERDLPAHVMVYYAIALALYAEVSTREVLRCLLEGARWLGDPDAQAEPASWSGISQARTRLIPS